MKSANSEPQKNTALTIAPPQPVQPVGFPAFNVESLIAKAIEQGSAFEVMKELESMRQRVHAEQAEAAFNDAMSALQAELPVITKDKGVPTRDGKVAYRYAPMEAIEIQIRPYLQKHGFNHTFDTDTNSEQGWVIAKCHVSHRAGHSKTSVAKFPLGTKTPIMSDTQAYAAALTFANRRVLTNAYGIVLAGEDLDGQTGRPKSLTPSSKTPDAETKALVVELWGLLKPVRGTKADWDAANEWLYANDILDPAVEPPMRAPYLDVPTLKAVISKVKTIKP